MIQNLTNILRLAYFSDSNNGQQHTKSAHKSNSRHGKSKFNRILDPHLAELHSLITSQEPIQRWYIQFQINKDNRFVRKTVFQSIMNGTITIHNLFLMLIQFKIFTQQIWLPIEKLCALKGGRDNQLCCLIHYTVSNQTGSYNQNPPGKWTQAKAERELGSKFAECYTGQISLSDKVAIMPMLILLSRKNSIVLWKKLSWLKSLCHDLLCSLQNNMRNLLQQDVHEVMEPDCFTEKLLAKSFQLCEVQGFISPQNLFSAAYQLYGFSQLLQLLINHRPYLREESEEYKVILKNFLTSLLQIFRQYQFDLTKNSKDYLYLIKIVINNKLYLQELTDKDFINHYVQNMLQCYASKPTLYKQKSKQTLVMRISRSFSKNHHNEDMLLDKNSLESNRQVYKQFIANTPQHILTNFLYQFYLLRPQYLETLSFILRDCHELINDSLEEIWSENSSWFYRLQLYLLKNYLPEFLIENFVALETNHIDNLLSYNESKMIYYYDVIAFMLKGNPISYGHFDRIILQMKEEEEQESKSSEEKNKKERESNISKFLKGFLEKIVVSKDAVMHIIGDQLQWKQNVEQNYPNANYESYFVSQIFSNEAEWLVNVIYCICLIKIDNSLSIPSLSVQNSIPYTQYYLTIGPKVDKQPNISQLRLDEYQYFKWITFLLMLYYYFQEVQRNNRNSKLTKIDQLLHKQKFLQKLYHVKFHEKVEAGDNFKIKAIPALQLLNQKLSDWEQYYNKHSKSVIIEFGLSYPITKMVKNKLRKKIMNFLKRKQFEEKEMPDLRY